jgi:ABC-2 type transport system permease protein
MARLLVQLKLRILLGALRSSRSARVTFIISTIVAALVAAGTFAGLGALRGNSAAVDETSVVFTSFAFAWVILPLITFSLDSTLDPATLALYPLRSRQLAVGLLAASFTGAWPLANVIGLLGVTVGLARGALGLIIAVLAVLLQVLFCIVLSRFVTTSLAAMLRSRRGRDFAVLLIIPIFVAYEAFGQVVPRMAATGKLTAASFSGVDAWLRWLPPGLAAHSVQDASTGHAGTALLRLAVLAAVIAVLGWLWIRSLSRAMVTADTTTQGAAVRGVALPFARWGLRGTVMARFWLYQRREPGSLVYWALTAVIMAVISFRTVLSDRYLGGLLGSAAAGGAFIGVFHANAIAMNGPAFSLEATGLTGRRSLRAYFSGQDLALAVIGVPLITAISFGLAALAGHPVDGFLGMATGLAGIGAGLALSNIFSVTLAYPVERRPGNPAPRPADGYMGYRIAGTFGGIIATGVAILPVVFAVLLTQSDPAGVRMPALVICAAAYGLALAWAGVRIAAQAADQKLPELAQIAMRSSL